MSKKTELMTSLIFLLLGVGMVIQSQSMTAVITDDIGPGFLPRIVGIGFIALSVIKILFALRIKSKSESPYSDNDIDKNYMIKGIVTVVIFTIYVLLFRSLGFLISSIVYLFFEITLLKWHGGKFFKGLKATILISIILPAAIYLLFTGVLDLILPAGILG